MSFFFRSKKQTEFKKWHLVVLLIILGSALGYKIFWSDQKIVSLALAGKVLKVLVADTPERRSQGLGGASGLSKADGMLFVFNDFGQHAMVMRQMKFPIDIVWLNGKAVVDIAPGVLPEEGVPESRLTPYFGREPSTAVLELPAGFALKYGLKVGDAWKLVAD